MPSDYTEIPGVYSETPRNFVSLRRNLRTYKWCLGATAFTISVIVIAIVVSVLIGSSIEKNDDPVKEQFTSDDPRNESLGNLLNLRWPRRDETWYQNQNEPTQMRHPFASAINDSEKRDNGASAGHGEMLNGGDSVPETHADGTAFPEEYIFNWDRKPSELPESDVNDISIAMSRGTDAQNERKRIEDDLEVKNISIESRSPSFFHQTVFNKAEPKALILEESGFKMDHATRSIKDRLGLSKETTTYDSRWLGDLQGTPYCSVPHRESRNLICSKDDVYRSADGSCNNLNNPSWGAAFTPYRRLLPPDYSDGVMSPRKRKDGKDLPNVRRLSTILHFNKYAASKSYTHLTMSWGQFIDHDITATAQSKGKNGNSLSCCSKEVLKNKTLQHPECFPIEIPFDDAFYRSKNMTCMEFARSASAPRCQFGPRQQLNKITHFLDGSTIYGSSPEQQNELRTHTEGLLRTQVTTDGRQLLSPSLNANDSCNTAQQMYWNQHCFVSGDSRVNEHILLTIMHTLWTRQHNSVAAELRDINPGWDDEKLFQETRRIIIAQIQHITYHEFLPSVLGPELSYGLKLSPTISGNYWNSYDPKVHPGIANVFAAAAFRFGHSMIQGVIQTVDGTGKNVKFERLQKYYFNPFILYEPDSISDFVRGEVSQNNAAVDTYFTSQVTDHLFETPGKTYGLDLVAVNLQRGRDHGIASYSQWRMMCGFPHAKNFSDLASVMDAGALSIIQQEYSSIDDVDLYSGGLAELPITDGLVGPTFACIIADQFLRLKVGDRFWYENGPSQYSFTKEQLTELHKTSLARILCDTTENLSSVQRWPLRIFDTNNARLPCSSKTIPRLEFDAWEETS